MEGAVEAVKDLMEDFDVYIVSAAMEFPLSLYEKQQWLQEHFPFISWKNIIFCGDKSIIDVDFLIDDHCKNLDFCKGKPLMFTAFHNVNHHHHQRVSNWNEIPALVRDLASIRKKIDSLAPVEVPQRPRW
jgi:5'(3')-deoxyribonucleotidase